MSTSELDLRKLCRLHDDVYSFNRADQVEHLSSLIDSQATDAAAFFEKNHITSGMREFLRSALKRLAGQSSQGVFELKQAMGGGKTHNMITLGMVAKNPGMSRYLPEDITSGIDLQPVRLAAVNGRSVDRGAYLWGDIAKQLGRGHEFQHKWKDGPVDMSEQDWMDLIGGEPTLIMLDELPPYFAKSVTHKVGDGNLLDLLVYSLSNLFSAAMKLPRTVVVIASLDAAYEDVSQRIGSQLRDIKKEARRGAKSITPVDLNTNEIYDILRKRLFAEMPGSEQVASVQETYRKVLKEGAQSGVLPKASESLADEVVDSYPFHPSYKDILALFKENEKFRQTRGLIEFSANLMRSVWERGESYGDVLLAGVQDINFADMGTRDQVKDIERTLESALSKDVYDNDDSSHAQSVDRERGDHIASMISGMLFVSSLSDNADGIKGLSLPQLTQYLVRPGVNVTMVHEAFDALKERCWYLHTRGDDKWYFSDTANLKKRLDEKAENASYENIQNKIKQRIEDVLKPYSGEAYSKVVALPKMSDINLGASTRVCLVLSPDHKSPPEIADRLLSEQTYKNSFCIISSDGSRMSTLEDNARRLLAIEDLEKVMGNNPQYAVDLANEKEVTEMAFLTNMTSIFNKLWYPSGRPGKEMLRPVSLDLAAPEVREKQGTIRGENAVISALASTSAKKLWRFTDEKGQPLPAEELHELLEKLVVRAEDQLFPPTQSRMRWKDIVDRAAALTQWPWLPPKKLEEVRNSAVRKDRWSHDENDYVDCRPPAPKPQVTVNTLNFDRQSGQSELDIVVGNAGPNAQVYVSSKPDALIHGDQIQAGRMTTGSVELWFAVIDPDSGEQSEEIPWRGEIALTHEVQTVGNEHRVALTASPNAQIRWNTSGINEKEGEAVKSGESIVLDAREKTVLYVYAVSGSVEARKTFTIEAVGTEKTIDNEKPARMEKKHSFGSRQEVYSVIDSAAKNEGVELINARINIGEGADTVVISFGSNVSVTGKKLRSCLDSMKALLEIENPNVTLTISSMQFDTGYTLASFAEEAGISITPDDVEQDL